MILRFKTPKTHDLRPRRPKFPRVALEPLSFCPFQVTSITSVPLYGTVVPCHFLKGVAIVPIRVGEVTPLKVINQAGLGGDYANDVSVLCGNWLCGGPLGFPAGSSASRRSRYPFPVTGPAVEISSGSGARTRCASISSTRALTLRPLVLLPTFPCFLCVLPISP